MDKGKLQCLVLTITFKVLATLASAQSWRSSLCPTDWQITEGENFYTDVFIQDFSYAAYHSGEKEIPTLSNNTIVVTKAPYNADKAGKADASVAIQSTINKAGYDGGGVVYLPAGTYKVAPGSKDYALNISKSNVVLRGDGKGYPFIYCSPTNMREKIIIYVNGNCSNWGATDRTQYSITKDLMRMV